MREANPVQTVKKFNQYINEGNLEGLTSLMTKGHTFIDSQGDIIQGKVNMVSVWRDFFTAYPNYENHFERVGELGNTVILHGYSTCSNEPALEGPAIWTAKVQGGLVAEWRVYEDTKENRKKLELI